MVTANLELVEFNFKHRNTDKIADAFGLIFNAHGHSLVTHYKSTADHGLVFFYFGPKHPVPPKDLIPLPSRLGHLDAASLAERWLQHEAEYPTDRMRGGDGDMVKAYRIYLPSDTSLFGGHYAVAALRPEWAYISK